MTDVLNRPAAPAARSTAQRREDVLRKLTHERHLWLATAGAGPHMIPLSYLWDGKSLLMTTKLTSRTVRNLRADPRARAALGTGADVVLVDGEITFEKPEDLNPIVFRRLPLRPDRVPGTVALRLSADTIQAWRGVHEIPGRIVRQGGRWVS